MGIGERGEEIPKAARIVIICNDFNAAGGLCENMTRHGVQTVKLYDHQNQVLADLQSQSFPDCDLIVTDLKLPQTQPDFTDYWNGVRLIQEIRLAGINSQIILLSTSFPDGSLDQELINTIESLSVTLGVMIPVPSKELADLIKNRIANPQDSGTKFKTFSLVGSRV